jgi:hypothetical protein
LMAGGVNPASHSGDDDQVACGKFPAEPLRHLCAIECRPARSDDTYAGQIQNLRNQTGAERVQTNGKPSRA